MTDRLDPSSRNDLINYKFERASQTIQEAYVLANAKFFNAAVNRLYYAAYYAASALMLTNALETVTHKGIKTMLGLKFIQTGKLDSEFGRIYQKLFNCRQAGDYDEFIYYDEETFNELRPLAVKFIEGLKKFMEGQK